MLPATTTMITTLDTTATMTLPGRLVRANLRPPKSRTTAVCDDDSQLSPPTCNGYGSTDSSGEILAPPPPPPPPSPLPIHESPRGRDETYNKNPTQRLNSPKLQESIEDELQFDFPSLREYCDNDDHDDDENHNDEDASSTTSSLELRGTDSEIRDAIDAIRKEASQMDAIMALDQLKTLQSELEVVTKQFQERSLEAEDLRLQLEESEDRRAHLELERDLHQADANKLKQDLKTCVENMFDLSLVERSAFHAETDENQRGGSVTNITDELPSPGHAAGQYSAHKFTNKMPTGETSGPTKPSSSSYGRSHMRIVGMSEHPRREVVRRPPTLSDPGLLRIQYTSQTSDLSDDSVYLLADKKRHPTIDGRQDVFRRLGPRPLVGPKRDSPRVHKRSDGPDRRSFQTRSRSLPDSQARRSRSLSAARHDYRGERVTREEMHSLLDTEDADNEGTKMCGGIFKRRHSKRSSRDRDISVMTKQISNLHEMMRTSLEASEKLRKRLATISKYYEGVIGKLQEQVVDCKMEKSRTEVELRNQLSQADLGRRMAVSQFEAELRRKDGEIARLKQTKIVDKGEV